ncbi:unnamed protein product [Brassica oleracea var. botrytis]
MQPSRRSAQLKQVMEATETVLPSSLTATPSTSRKRQRKRPSASSTALPLLLLNRLRCILNHSQPRPTMKENISLPRNLVTRLVARSSKQGRMSFPI